MCLIVDTNVAHFLVRPDSTRTIPIVRWIKAGGVLIWGGRLTFELKHNRNVASFLAVLQRRGQMRSAGRAELRKEICRIKDLCKSDDAHIIALARLVPARVLFTDDQAFRKDFLDRDLIDRPRGRLYTDAGDQHLLGPDTCRRQTP